MAHWAFRTTFTAVAGDHSFSSRSAAGANRCSLGGIASPMSRGDAVGRVEQPAHHGKVDAQIGEHAGILRALAGKQKRQRSWHRLIRAARSRNRCRGRRGSSRQAGSLSLGETAVESARPARPETTRRSPGGLRLWRWSLEQFSV